MPPPYNATHILQHYVGEDVLPNPIWGTAVRYLSATDRAAYALSFSGGLIRDANGNLFDTRNATSVHSSSPRAIFVMDSNGTFYASNDQMIGDFHHSSFLAGGAVAAAGELEVENGVLKTISDKSGHYRPRRPFGDQAIDRLGQIGVTLQGVTVDYVGAP
jgi:hypothetical protein